LIAAGNAADGTLADAAASNSANGSVDNSTTSSTVALTTEGDTADALNGGPGNTTADTTASTTGGSGTGSTENGFQGTLADSSVFAGLDSLSVPMLASVTFGGRSVSVLAGIGASVTGVPNAVMSDIEGFFLSDSGHVAYTGDYISGTSIDSGIWAGPVGSPSLLYGSGSLIAGIKSASISRSAIAFSTGPAEEQTGTTLWYQGNGTPVAVAEQFDSTDDAAAEAGNTCRVSTGVSNNYQGSFGVTDAGDLVFDAHVKAYPSEESGAGAGAGAGTGADADADADADVEADTEAEAENSVEAVDPANTCIEGNAVIRFNGSSHTVLVKEGDAVPGAPASTFSNVKLLQLTSNGTALISADIESPEDNASAEGKWSYWAYTPAGQARLVALQGEAIPIGTRIKVLDSKSSERHVRINDAGQAAMRLDFGDAEQVTLLGGYAHNAQPHGVLSVPGASSLMYTIDKTAVIPPPFNDTELFSVIGTPYIDAAGKIVFYGEITSPDPSAITLSAIWQIDLEGNLAQIFRSGDTVNVSAIDVRRLQTLAQSSEFGKPDSGSIWLNSRGALMFMASPDSESAGSVLVYVAPAE